jgi:tetratricopeptide (TPR) repeat protein
MAGHTVPGLPEVKHFAGNIDEAEEHCKEGIRNNPESMYAHTLMALIIGCKGDWAKSLEIMEHWQQVAQDPHLFAAFVGYAHAKTGDTAKTHEYIARFLDVQKQQDGPPVSPLLALLYIALGDKENFYLQFKQAMKEKALTILYFYNSPFFAEVNGEERIRRIRREHRLPE